MKLNDPLSRISWQDFEILVANRYRRHGWDVAHCGSGRLGFRDDAEVHLRMKKDGELALVQCRHESRGRFDARTVERLLAMAAEERATQVIVIASDDVPDDARQLAESGGATIIEGVAVREMLDDDLLDVRAPPPTADADAERRRAQMLTTGKMPRLTRGSWRLPALIAALTAMGLIAIYGPTLVRSRMEHPLPPQVDQATLSGGATVPANPR